MRGKVSFYGLSRSASNLKYFGKIYMPLYEATIEDFFSAMPALVFAEAFIYDMDKKTEHMQKAGIRMNDMRSDVALARKQLASTLKAAGAYNAYVEGEISNLSRYIDLETKVVRGAIPRQELGAVLDEMLRLRSSDLRLLHHIFLKSKKITPISKLLHAIMPLEMLYELEDEIKDYHRDHKSGVFNSIRTSKQISRKLTAQTTYALIKKLESEFMLDADALTEPYRTRMKKVFLTYRAVMPAISLGRLKKIVEA